MEGRAGPLQPLVVAQPRRSKQRLGHPAIAFVDRIEGKRVVLIDGDQLAELMIQHNVGVTTTETYEVKSLSGDFFDEDEG